MTTFIPGQAYLPDPVFTPSSEEPHEVGFLVGPLRQACGYDQAQKYYLDFKWF